MKQNNKKRELKFDAHILLKRIERFSVGIEEIQERIVNRDCPDRNRLYSSPSEVGSEL
ncbi:MAG TPA: hypothetical protein VJK54_00505 [Chthoniobacterales bacterium]|nr:hypothetical protein [Chthoniobacterales bacterium]